MMGQLTGLVVLSLVGHVLSSSSSSSSNSSCRNDLPHTSAMMKHHNTCYQFVYVEKYWTEARDYCRMYNGRLLKIDSAETNNWIVNTLNGLQWHNNGVWIGLHDRFQELRWSWDGGRYQDEAISWSNWGRGHPAATLHRFRDCVRMVRGGGSWKWHETPCHVLKWHYRFICQYPVNKPVLFPTPASNYRVHHGSLDTETQHLSTDDMSVHREHEGHVGGVAPLGHEGHVGGGASGLQAESREREKNSSAGTVALVSLSIIVVTALLVVLFILRRRRYTVMKQLEVDEEIYSDIAGDKDSKDLNSKDLDSKDLEKKKERATLKASDYLKREKEVWVTLLSSGGNTAAAGIRSVRSIFRKPVQNTYVESPTAVTSTNRSSIPPRAAISTPTDTPSAPGATAASSRSNPLYLDMDGATYDKIQEDLEEVHTGVGGDEYSKEGGVGGVYENSNSGSEGCGGPVKSGVGEYDAPRQANVYSEIPEMAALGDDSDDDDDDDHGDEEEIDHIYECLADVKKRELLRKSTSDEMV